MINERELEDLKHDAEAAREIGETMVVRVNCVVMLELLEELHRQQLQAQGLIEELERQRLLSLRRVLMAAPERD